MTLTKEQFSAINEMVERRMANTKETRMEACKHIKRYFSRKPQLLSITK